MKRRALPVLISITLALVISSPAAFSTVKAGETCTTLGQIKTVAGQKLECKKIGNKKVWTKSTSSAPSPKVVGGVQTLLTKIEQTVLNQTITYPASGAAQVSSAIVTLIAGEETGWHRHDAPMYAYIFSGTLQVSYEGGVVKTYKTGDAILEAIGTYHNGQNIGKDPVRIIVVNIGAVGVENTVKKI